ncbi:MAG: PhnD/SsuA/transferrin family substrate-binding protein [Planctomycetota bacterium]
MRHLCTTMFGAALLAAAPLKAQSPQPQPERPRETIRLGKVTIKRISSRKNFAAFMAYLEKKGYAVAPLRTPASIEDMVTLVREGEVNLVLESPYGAVRLMDEAKLDPVLLREKSGAKDYSAVLFVPRKSPVKELSDLVGKVVVFEDKGSTSSYFLPRRILEKAGLDLVHSQVPVAGKVSYWFSLDDVRSIRLVAEDGRFAGGGIDKSKVQDDERFRMLTPESAKVPRHVVLAGRDLDHRRLCEVLLAMKEDAEARQALEDMLTPTGFSKLPGDARRYLDEEVRDALGLRKQAREPDRERKVPTGGPGR